MVVISNIKKGCFILSLIFIFGLLLTTENVGNEKGGSSHEMGSINGTPRPSLLSANYSKVIDLSDDPLESLTPAIATDSKNNVHVVWSDGQYGATDDNTYIYYKMYNRTTASWGSVENISLNNGNNDRPDITVDKDDNIHVVWAGMDYQSDSDIYYRNKTFATGTWGSPINVTNDDEGSGYFQLNPKIAINSTNDLQIVWMDATGAQRIKGIVVPAGNWGLNYTLGTLDTQDTASIFPEFDLAADLKYFHLVWAVQSTPRYIWYMNSSDGSLHDDGTDAYLLHSAPSAYHPTLFVSNNTGGFVKIYTAWASNIDTAYDILSKNATDYRGFGSVVNVTAGLTPDFKLPRVAVDKDGLMFVLYADSTNYWIRMTNSSAYGSFTYVQDWAHASENVANPALTIDTNGSLHFVWEDDQQLVGTTYYGASDTDIFYRTFDRYPPHVTITSPGNFTLVKKYLTISGMTDTDTQYVNVSYQVKGQSTWNYINGTENDTMNFRNGWSVDWYPTLSYPNVTIRANATDFNAASDEAFIYNLTIDPVDPTAITLVNIVDSYGNNYMVGGDTNFTGTITVSYTTTDDAQGTGVKNVTLYDGTTYLSEFGTNDTNTQIIFNTGDDTYLGTLKLRATDRAGNYYDSAVITDNIRFDHTAPNPVFKYPLVPYTKVCNTFWIQVNGTGGDLGDDWDHVDFERSATGSSWTYLGTNTTACAVAMGADNIGIEFDTSSIFEDTEYWLRATIYDVSWQNTTIVTQLHVDNNKPDFIIDVDRTDFDPVNFTDDDYGQEVGISVYINVLTDNDTVMVRFYNKTNALDDFSGPTALLLENTSGVQYTFNTKLFNATWNTIWSPSLSVFIKIEVTDDMGNVNSTDEIVDSRYSTNDPGGHGFMLTLQQNVPGIVYYVNATLCANKTAIFIEWSKSKDDWGLLRGYAIYRLYSYEAYYIYNILNIRNPIDITEYLSYFTPWLVIQIEDPTAQNYTDTDLDANTYFYIVIAYNTWGTPSDVGPQIPGVEVPPTQPVRKPDYTFDRILEFIVIVLIALWGIIPIAGYSITRRAAKRDLIDFTMDVNVIKGFNQPKSFEKDVSDLDIKMRKELGMEVSNPAETEFLQQEIVKSVAGVEVKESTLKNCPQCGWVLSAGATKCIRCGYVLGTPAAQPDDKVTETKLKGGKK